MSKTHELIRITLPDYYVDTKDRRRTERGKGKTINRVSRQFSSLEELAKWTSKNKDKVARVHWKSEDPWTHALGKAVEEFAEFLFEKNVEIYKKTYWKDSKIKGIEK